MNRYNDLSAMFKEYSTVFEALSNPNRQLIMFTLAKKAEAGTPLTVRELADLTELSRPTISHHVKVLKKADLLIANNVGTKVYYKPKFETPLRMARRIVDKLENVHLKANK